MNRDVRPDEDAPRDVLRPGLLPAPRGPSQNGPGASETSTN